MTDGYKTSHHKMYPEGTSLVYSNFTPRSVKYMDENAKEIVVAGTQYTMRYIHEMFQQEFFGLPKEMVLNEAKSYLSSYLGTDYDVTHFEKLYDLGFLPINVKSLPEGTIVKERVPILTIYNTLPDFYWLPNFLETLISCLLWKPMHSASMAYGFKKILMSYANKTDKNNINFVNFQGHDFSFRGMQHCESAISSGLGFLMSFYGTDTIPALKAAKDFYDDENVGFSVPASEHAVMTAYGKENELEAFRRILKQYPSGIVSVVSDSFDLWQVCTKFVTELKDEIMNRDGKLVIRPDSGDPVDIICGKNSIIRYDTEEFWELYYDKEKFTFQNDNIIYKFNGDILLDLYMEYGEEVSYNTKTIEDLIKYGIVSKMEIQPSLSELKGVIELLWDVFGGSINDQGYKVLDSHIGAILGDGVTLQRAKDICERLEKKGFASTNLVFGIGSYSMGYCTRDQQGSAVKATYVEIQDENGVTTGREIFKDPLTDDGTKKSATGLLSVHKDDNGSYILKEKVTWEEEQTGCLNTIYKNGEFFNKTTLTEIRNRLNNK